MNRATDAPAPGPLVAPGAAIEERARLRSLLGLDPVPAKHGEPLTPAQERRLAEMIAEWPEATHPAIARKFAAESGRLVAASTVQARRGPRPATCLTRPLSAEQAEVLAALVRRAGPQARRADIAAEFEAATGRPVSAQTVTAYATWIHGPRRLRAAEAQGGSR